MTPEQIAEARRLVDEANLWSDTSVEWADFASQAKRLIPQLLDALEAAERERDEARADTRELLRRYDEEVKISVGKNAEINTARAQVATLAEALRSLGIGCLTTPPAHHHNANTCVGCIAAAALKAAGVEP